jgi:hypothetical protein
LKNKLFRPSGVTAIAIFNYFQGALLIALSLFIIGVLSVQGVEEYIQLGFPFLSSLSVSLTLGILAGFCFVIATGLLYMKKWALYLYVLFLVFMILSSLFTFSVNILTIIHIVFLIYLLTKRNEFD